MSSSILTISGSARAGSFNTHLINSFPGLAPEGMTFTQMDWRSIPLYNQDLETSFPAEVIALKEQILAADGIIISTPEYNRSIPAPLKNLIDWTSRPYGDSAWAGKKVLVVGASASPLGTALAQTDLKKVLLYLNAHVLGQPEFYLASAHEKFDTEGVLTDETTKEHVRAALAAFAAYLAA